MRISVILSTYNNPSALERALWGYRRQVFRDFEIIIADDGSTPDTRTLIASVQHRMPHRVRHLWQEDRGFRKNEILNRAVDVATGDYLIFSDGDCIPRDDFVWAHRRYARPNYFLAGGSHINIPEAIHLSLTENDVVSQRAFDPAWLRARGMSLKRRVAWRLTRARRRARLLDFFMPRPGVFVGCNASAWRRDVLAVNGFDASFTYGSDDKDLGVRLTNHGIRSRRLKHSLVCLHLAHAKNYPLQQIQHNKHILRMTKTNKVTWTDNGVHSQRAA